jgi:hypothetical protein
MTAQAKPKETGVKQEVRAHALNRSTEMDVLGPYIADFIAELHLARGARIPDNWEVCPFCAGEGPGCDACDGSGHVHPIRFKWITAWIADMREVVQGANHCLLVRNNLPHRRRRKNDWLVMKAATAQMVQQRWDAEDGRRDDLMLPLVHRDAAWPPRWFGLARFARSAVRNGRSPDAECTAKENRKEVQDAQDDRADGDDGMSRSLWRCRNRACREPHGVVLGRVTADGGLVLDPAVEQYAIFMDTGRAVIGCPGCGQVRGFRGVAVFSAKVQPARSQ